MPFEKKIEDREIVQFIDSYKKNHGYAPFPAEIARGLNVTRQAVPSRIAKIPELAKHDIYKKYFIKK